jgi:hypothetical protein
MKQAARALEQSAILHGIAAANAAQRLNCR